MTLNGVIALILRISPNSIALQADYVRMVEETYNVCKISSSMQLYMAKTDPNARSSRTVSLRQRRA